MYCKILIKIGIYYILHCYYISHCYTGLLFLLDYLCYRPGTFDDWFTMKNIHIDNFFRKPYENFLHTNKSCLTVYHDCFICKIIVLKNWNYVNIVWFLMMFQFIELFLFAEYLSFDSIQQIRKRNFGVFDISGHIGIWYISGHKSQIHLYIIYTSFGS